jgi:hypothetical protein
VRFFDLGERGQGIVHVMAPELGIVLPGLTVICGDSHTCTNGGLGALAFGIGSSESTHALATQTLRQQKPRRMRIRCDGALAAASPPRTWRCTSSPRSAPPPASATRSSTPATTIDALWTSKAG